MRLGAIQYQPRGRACRGRVRMDGGGDGARVDGHLDACVRQDQHRRTRAHAQRRQSQALDRRHHGPALARFCACDACAICVLRRRQHGVAMATAITWIRLGPGEWGHHGAAVCAGCHGALCNRVFQVVHWSNVPVKRPVDIHGRGCRCGVRIGFRCGRGLVGSRRRVAVLFCRDTVILGAAIRMHRPCDVLDRAVTTRHRPCAVFSSHVRSAVGREHLIHQTSSHSVACVGGTMCSHHACKAESRCHRAKNWFRFTMERYSVQQLVAYDRWSEQRAILPDTFWNRVAFAHRFRPDGRVVTPPSSKPTRPRTALVCRRVRFPQRYPMDPHADPMCHRIHSDLVRGQPG
eukprot:m.1093330 g.1093330  ORF g.1093330 m.1093330 type:complete len:347 (-) comp24296_c0_seq4:2804-3844(-)